MRTNFTIHFHCSDCGNQLDIVTEEEGKPLQLRETEQRPKEPTGAACHYAKPVMVKPCRYCIESKTGPAKRLLAAIREMKEGK